MTDPLELAEQTLREDMDSAVVEVAAFFRELAPRYRSVSDEDLRDTLLPVLTGLIHVARGAEVEQLIGVVADVYKQRRSEGFATSELLTIAHGYLPAIRRLLVRRHGPVEGLRIYDAVEVPALRALPHIYRLLIGEIDDTVVAS
jgi:hypothetical protein